ncbi:hypothetical protein J2S78_002717 [Salibacterium salarium]|uniref:glycosyl hydrolase 115 family protein n=1 Tax=Salibacterium salarium TaxID=284579 RepID=UPI0027866125|nr:glycosyl hydrolase 115 family protein [Salibacterium salarium]MDQ0300270.1 hypothetical protein [Salibacterium salarium]
MKDFIFDKNTTIFYPQNIPLSVQHGIDIFLKDVEKVLQGRPKPTSEENATFIIRYADKEDDTTQHPEGYSIRFTRTNNQTIMYVIGADDLGIVYGLLHISETYFSIDPFWYWADLPPTPRSAISIPTVPYDSIKPAVEFRGWFINDEVCLIGWDDVYPPTKDTWFPVFEALLRCGGNMVLPGTDLPKDGIHAELAAEMGLWVTHHHAEPLGAEMFLRAYPREKPSYQENPMLFEQLWKEAIEKQKNKKIVWVLSFRGQGDKPFWEDDPSFDTPEKRGALISEVIWKQFELIQEKVEDPYCCTAMYGEIAELYQQGMLNLPEKVIKIWADNGYGRMVSRRHGNDNKRVASLPSPSEPGVHGLYYHVTFHDLQASNHLTMFPSSSGLIQEELDNVFKHDITRYWLINSGNIRMHTYYLDVISKMWMNKEVDVDNHLKQFVERAYSSLHQEIIDIYKFFSECTIQYGSHRDDKAGEEFYHHPARIIIGRWMTGKGNEPEEKLIWAAGEQAFYEQVVWFHNKCSEALKSWTSLLTKAETTMEQLSALEQQRFYDQLLVQIKIHESGCKGFVSLCDAYFSAQNKQYPLAFVQAHLALQYYEEGKTAMKKSEHGKWENFYSADWLTNIDATIYSIQTLRSYIRMFGDNPDYFIWYKEYLMPETEKYIYLENTHREPLSDEKLANALLEYLF